MVRKFQKEYTIMHYILEIGKTLSLVRDCFLWPKMAYDMETFTLEDKEESQVTYVLRQLNLCIVCLI